jgi:TonB family protein
MSDGDHQPLAQPLAAASSRGAGRSRRAWRARPSLVLPSYRLLSLLALLSLLVIGCSERQRAGRPDLDGWWNSGQPDVVPQMLNDELPFRYPVALYIQRVQGNVMLRLYVDSSGFVVPDSTRVVEPSGYPALDSAALAGAARLRFRGARRRGVPIAVSMLFPVHFRHPEGPRLPGDSTR